MAVARNYWISTASQGFPNSRPVWGVWRACHLYFSTGSAIAKNISRDSRIQVNLESGDELVILEGHASAMPDVDIGFWVDAYRKKYNWEMPQTAEGVYRVIPARVLAWICDSSGLDGGMLFSNTATEWRFDGDV